MSRVANRYGKAFFQLAKENRKIELLESEMTCLLDLIRNNKEFSDMLVNPLITAAKKADIVTGLFTGTLDPLSCHFLILVCRNKRSNLLAEIVSNFLDRVLEEKGIWKGTVYSAHPLASDQLDEIRKQTMNLTGKTILLEEHVDQSLVGGFIVKIKDTVIDLSVKGQLSRLRTKLVFG
jgi:F-type H+-transporting ATPase subunit delta